MVSYSCARDIRPPSPPAPQPSQGHGAARFPTAPYRWLNTPGETAAGPPNTTPTSTEPPAASSFRKPMVGADSASGEPLPRL